MLSIRLQRIGKKHQPSYRLVVAEKRSKLIAPPVEDLGSYNPTSKLSTLKKDRILHWLQKGAGASVTAHNLLVKEGLLSTPKVQMKFTVKKAEAEANPASDSVPSAIAAETEPEKETETPAETAPTETIAEPAA